MVRFLTLHIILARLRMIISNTMTLAISLSGIRCLIIYIGDLRTVFEIRNAMNLVVAAFGERMDFDQLFLRKLQYELTKNTYDARRYSIG